MIHLLVATAASAAALQPLRVVAPAAARRGGAPRCSAFIPGETCTGEKVVVVGATGYIGKAVVRESVARGYPTVAVVRDAVRAQSEPKFAGATVAQADVCDAASLGRPGGSSQLKRGVVVLTASGLWKYSTRRFSTTSCSIGASVTLAPAPVAPQRRWTWRLPPAGRQRLA